MGRTAAGVRGVRLRPDDYVVGSAILAPDSKVLVVSEKGYGKQTPASEYAIKGRGIKGVKTLNITEKNGPVAGLTTVKGGEDLLVITDEGVIIRFNTDDVSETGRATMGVRLMKLDKDAMVSAMTKVEPEDDEDEDEDDSQPAGNAGEAGENASDSETPAPNGEDDEAAKQRDVNRLLDRAESDTDSDDNN